MLSSTIATGWACPNGALFICCILLASKLVTQIVNAGVIWVLDYWALQN